VRCDLGMGVGVGKIAAQAAADLDVLAAVARRPGPADQTDAITAALALL